jgi:hypothetical protein
MGKGYTIPEDKHRKLLDELNVCNHWTRDCNAWLPDIYNWLKDKGIADLEELTEEELTKLHRMVKGGLDTCWSYQEQYKLVQDLLFELQANLPPINNKDKAKPGFEMD